MDWLLQPRPAAPLTCYGIDYGKTVKLCLACVHQADCRVASGKRAACVPLDQVMLKVLPEGLLYTRLRTQDAYDFQTVYDNTYWQVFGCYSGHSVGRLAQTVKSQAQTAGCDVHLCLMANMLGYLLTWPDRPFTPAALTDPRAPARIRTWTAECLRRYAGVTETAINLVTGFDFAARNTSTRMLRSEIVFGGWMIAYHLRQTKTTQVWDDCEALLDPAWLAIEPAYQVDTHLDRAPKTSSPIEKHRSAVVATRAMFKRHKHLGAAAFLGREASFKQALQTVLGTHGYTLHDFDTLQPSVTDARLFWHKLGTAIQHYELIKFTHGLPCAFSSVPAPHG